MKPAASYTTLDTTVDVDTPEQVRFRFQVAGPGRRGLAYLIDGLIRGGIVLFGAILFRLVAGGEGEGFSTGFTLLLLFLVEWGYYVLLESLTGGSTPGKRALRLRVIKEGGYPLGFLDSVLRNLLRAADFLPFGYVIGLCVSAVDPRFRRLGDRVAGTLVIVEEQKRITARTQIPYEFAPEELEWLPSALPLQRAELDAIDRLLHRASELSPGRARELALLVAPRFAARLGVPAPEDPVRFLALLSRRVRGVALAA
jgi:uncharacterized RDD family membrane protein YckC